ncbi:phenylacetate--coenzyme A ligase [Geotalea daltonii FRC-32]|uniref:Phenylacetate-coenzyme A ligase n=1 Tax=Geotalea daltonii (strain DSM 22248 / JCM 15807 / FRC-32) TaxID=316067 RepID=B9M8J9_GEODF|nr:phenylacetate--CoA ligase [Geotalea daltonii]ACM18534.1 phenylacetate--coenzyme A ligase [Geotalea daltonii FRC-32]
MIWNHVETSSRNEMKSIQLGRLQQTVSRVYDNNPVYRKRLDENGVKPAQIKTLDDIRRLPFTVKDDIRDNYPFNLFTAKQEDVVEYHATSGTTGKPIIVGYTRNDLDTWSEVMARCLTSAGITKNDVLQNIYGYGLFTGGLGAHYGGIKIGAAVIPISGGNTQKQIMLMQDFGTTALTVTPSFLMHVQEVGTEMGIDFRKLKLRTAVLGAEFWTDSMRGKIQEDFGIKACDIYGLSEIIGPGVACECHEARNGLHINEDYFYPEIINPETGEVLPLGEEGELVFTTIANEGQPLFRYRTRDLTSLSQESCACGRTLVKMKKLVGRTDDLLIIRGVNFFPSQIESIILKHPGVTPHYLVVVERNGALDEVEVRIEVTDQHAYKYVAETMTVSQNQRVSDDRATRDIVKNLVRDIKDVVGITVKVTLMPPGTIPRSEGKAKRFIDNRPK